MEKTTKRVLITVGVIGLIAMIVKNEHAKKNPPKIILREGGRYNAQTLPPFGIFINKSQANNKALLEHELVHWRQYQKAGLLPYYFNYTKELVTHGYDKMPMEIAARANESSHCKTNYTQCVRKGKSKTIFNPTFRA